MKKDFKNNHVLEGVFLLTILLELLISDKYINISGNYIQLIMMIISFGLLILIVRNFINHAKMSVMDKELDIYKTKFELREYDRMREHLEKEITELQSKLVNSAEDWENINHLPLSAQKKEYTNGPIQNASFAKRFGLDETDIAIDKKMVFLLTPFSNKATDIYISIKNICSECGLNLYRGDEEFFHEDILANLVKYIVKSRIIIANIDGKNPNVFYELGIAHALGKPTILISKAIQEAPFDVQQNRIIIYTDKDDLKAKLSKELLRVLVEH